jgi:hypothetical protein
LAALISITTSWGGVIINPDAPTLAIQRGLLFGVPAPLQGTSANQPTIF